MKSKRINWKQRAISRLSDPDEVGMTKEEAITYFNRVYRNALKVTQGHQQNLNTTKEVYATMFYRSASTFQIDAKQNVVLNPIIQNTSNVAMGMALARMDSFFDKYKDDKQLQAIKNQYVAGTITRKEFNERIKDWKATSQHYLISGSK